jgi:hypothetical protein
MGLQLRLTYPDGEDWVEVDDRPVDRPILVGVGSDVDVALPPSVPGVSARHCFLFVHDGKWFIQDARTAAGTFRNGQRVLGPTRLASGDVVTLGSAEEAPVLTVDPYGIGLGGRPAVAVSEVEQSLAATVSARADRPFYVPGRKTASPAAILVTVFLLMAILGGGGWWLYAEYQKRGQVVIIQQPAPATTVTSRPATTRVVRIVQRTVAPAAVSQPATAPAEAPPDPRRSEPDWQAVEAARFEEPVIAIVKFNDYLERFPKSPFKADVNKYIEEALDRIWWKRIGDLFEEGDNASKQIDELKKQLALSQDGEFKKTLEAEIADWTERRKLADETIRKDMGYQDIGPPNPYDSAALAALRAKRNADSYLKWKNEVLRTIKRSRGQKLPWRSER